MGSAIQQAIHNLSVDLPVDGELTGLVAAEILEGKATPAQIGAFLVALRIRGERPEHLGAFVKAMRQFATPVEVPYRDKLVDTCGTGGDSLNTFNISTAAAIVAAGAGAKIAKHGNRAATGAPGSGSADVLAALGVNISCTPECSVQCLRECGLAFFFAPAYHAAMRFAGPARREIGVRSIMNLLGPLANPAGTMRQLIGVGAPELTEVFAHVLATLGAEHVMVVHGSDGMDELTLTGPSRVTQYRGGAVTTYQLKPEDYGLQRCRLEDLQCGGPAEERAAVIRAILDGQRGPRRTITELNAAAALIVGDRAGTFEEGLRLAARSIDTGAAKQVLQKLAAISSNQVESNL
ncbi:anthranilate phosphoribosyltransferase [bacterium]|nr:anthranilate phosphoribosyltransferase [bacterium]